MNLEKRMASNTCEELFEWEKWREEIPYINFPSDWGVKAVPPIAGAIIRYWIKKGNAWVSIYLDCYDMLGYVTRPYWEIYPNKEESESRFSMHDIEGLLKDISESLEWQLRSKRND